MHSETLLNCALSFEKLIGSRYIFHLGRAGKHVAFEITIIREDLHHLMGLHYLKDRPDRRNRIKIYNSILTSEEYRRHLSSSGFWTPELEARVACTTLLSELLDDNTNVIRYNQKRLSVYSQIKAEWLIAHLDHPITDNLIKDVYLFVDKRDHSDERFCKSIFPKKNLDYTAYQAVWQLLYKERVSPTGTHDILYRHKNYDPNDLLSKDIHN